LGWTTRFSSAQPVAQGGTIDGAERTIDQLGANEKTGRLAGTRGLSSMSWRGYVSRSTQSVRFLVDNNQMARGGNCFGVK